MKAKAVAQNIPNIQNAQWDPTAASNGLNPRVTAKPSVQQVAATIVDACDLTSGENISPKTAHGSGPNPTQYTKTNTINDTTGSHEIDFTISASCESKRKYSPKKNCNKSFN